MIKHVYIVKPSQICPNLPGIVVPGSGSVWLPVRLVTGPVSNIQATGRVGALGYSFTVSAVSVKFPRCTRFPWKKHFRSYHCHTTAKTKKRLSSFSVETIQWPSLPCPAVNYVLLKKGGIPVTNHQSLLKHTMFVNMGIADKAQIAFLGDEVSILMVPIQFNCQWVVRSPGSNDVLPQHLFQHRFQSNFNLCFIKLRGPGFHRKARSVKVISQKPYPPDPPVSQSGGGKSTMLTRFGTFDQFCIPFHGSGIIKSSRMHSAHQKLWTPDSFPLPGLIKGKHG